MAAIENESAQSASPLGPSANDIAEPTTESKITANQEEHVVHEPGTVPVQGGGFVRIHYQLKDFEETYLAEYAREVLPHRLAMDAIEDKKRKRRANILKNAQDSAEESDLPNTQKDKFVANFIAKAENKPRRGGSRGSLH